MKDLRERCEALVIDLSGLEPAFFDDETSLVEAFARKIRNEALEEVIKCLDREDSYYQHLDERGEVRDARYCTSVVRGYIRALKAQGE